MLHKRVFPESTYKDRKGQTDLNGKNLEGWKKEDRAGKHKDGAVRRADGKGEIDSFIID